MAKVELFARTEVGCQRERNEDAFLILNLATAARGLQPELRVQTLDAHGTVLAVCDGMGGAAAGDLAASMAIDALARTLVASAPFRDRIAVEYALQEGAKAANTSIMQYAAAHPELHGMGTTMTAALAAGPELVILNVGDSRAYLRRGRMFEQLTVDQSVVGQMLASGELTRDEARSFEQRNVLLQALGVLANVEPEIVVVDVRAGDVLLLCTDGLTGPLTDEAVLDLMLRYEDPMRCCRALTEAACAAGGPDNISVAIGRFTGSDLPIPQGREPIRVQRARVPFVSTQTA